MVYKLGFIACIKCNGKILRETFKDGESVVRIPFTSEYEISMKNLETRSALVKISIDDVDVNDSQIIIEPNSTTVLEGFLKNFHVTNKFKFIEKTEEISDFRGDRIGDGLIRIEYTFEAPQPQITYDYHYHHDHHFHDWWWPYYGPWYTYTSYAANQSQSSGVKGTVGPSGDCGAIGPSGDCGNVTAYSSSIQCNNVQTQSFSNDQGITVPGAKSDQTFQPGYTGILETNSHVIIIRLIGEKQGKKIEKAVFTNTKLSCPTCGRKSRSDSKFCKNCGTSLT